MSQFPATSCGPHGSGGSTSTSDKSPQLQGWEAALSGWVLAPPPPSPSASAHLRWGSHPPPPTGHGFTGLSLLPATEMPAHPFGCSKAAFDPPGFPRAILEPLRGAEASFCPPLCWAVVLLRHSPEENQANSAGVQSTPQGPHEPQDAVSHPAAGTRSVSPQLSFGARTA